MELLARHVDANLDHDRGIQQYHCLCSRKTENCHFRRLSMSIGIHLSSGVRKRWRGIVRILGIAEILFQRYHKNAAFYSNTDGTLLRQLPTSSRLVPPATSQAKHLTVMTFRVRVFDGAIAEKIRRPFPPKIEDGGRRKRQ